MGTPYGKKVSTRLRKALRKRKLTVLQASQMLGCSRLTVYNWLAGGGVSPAYATKVERFINKAG